MTIYEPALVFLMLGLLVLAAVLGVVAHRMRVARRPKMPAKDTEDTLGAHE